MSVRPEADAQLRLMLSTRSAVKMSVELERQLVTALADLLVAVATQAVGQAEGTEGGCDE